MKGIWHVDRQFPNSGVWISVPGSGGRKSYAQGWFDALTSMIPRPAYRLMNSADAMVEHRDACGGVQVNATMEQATDAWERGQ